MFQESDFDFLSLFAPYLGDLFSALFGNAAPFSQPQMPAFAPMTMPDPFSGVPFAPVNFPAAPSLPVTTTDLFPGGPWGGATVFPGSPGGAPLSGGAFGGGAFQPMVGNIPGDRLMIPGGPPMRSLQTPFSFPFNGGLAGNPMMPQPASMGMSPGFGAMPRNTILPSDPRVLFQPTIVQNQHNSLPLGASGGLYSSMSINNNLSMNQFTPFPMV